MAVIYLNALNKGKPPAPVEPDYSKMTPGEAMAARIQWEKERPPLFSISFDNVTVLDHDPAHPQWRRPIVWSGESERQVRAVAAELGFERIPFALEEYLVFNAYAGWLYKQKHQLSFFPQDEESQADALESFVYMTGLVHKPWVPGIDAYLRGDRAALEAAHAGDGIYQRLIENAGDEVWMHMQELLDKWSGVAAEPELEPELESAEATTFSADRPQIAATSPTACAPLIELVRGGAPAAAIPVPEPRKPAAPRSPASKTNRSTTELLNALLDAPVWPDSSLPLRESPCTDFRDGYMYNSFGCARVRDTSFYRPFQLTKLYRGIPGLSRREKLRVQSWRHIDLDSEVPSATSWWETTSGLADDQTWTSIPIDRVALLLAALAEGFSSRLPFDEDALAAGIINVRDADHLIRFSPALTSCKKQIAALQGKPFPRPLIAEAPPRHGRDR